MVFKYTNLLFLKTFLSKKNHKFIPPKKRIIEPDFVCNSRWLYYSMSLFINTNVRAYRLLLGYPVKGQRT